jgi:hypothetical protein
MQNNINPFADTCIHIQSIQSIQPIQTPTNKYKWRRHQRIQLNEAIMRRKG